MIPIPHIEHYFWGRIVKVNGTVDGDGLGDAATLSYDCEAVQTDSAVFVLGAKPRNRPVGITKVVAAKKGDPVVIMICPPGDTCPASEQIFSLTETIKFGGCA